MKNILSKTCELAGNFFGILVTNEKKVTLTFEKIKNNSGKKKITQLLKIYYKLLLIM